MEGKRDMTETLEKVGLVTLDYTDYSGKDLYLERVRGRAFGYCYKIPA